MNLKLMEIQRGLTDIGHIRHKNKMKMSLKVVKCP